MDICPARTVSLWGLCRNTAERGPTWRSGNIPGPSRLVSHTLVMCLGSHMFQAGITRIRHLTYYTCLAPRPHLLKVPSTHGQGRKIPEPTGEQGGTGSRGHHLPTCHIYTHYILSCMVHTCIPGHKAGPAAHSQDSLTSHQGTSHSRVLTPAGSRDPSPVYVGGRSPKGLIRATRAP